MAKRGTYAKGVARREEILDTALKVVAEHGYGQATLKQIADAVGLSQMGLLHYFDSKEMLFVEVLRRRDQLDTANFSILDRGVFSREGAPALLALVQHNAMVPGLVQLYARLSIEAAAPAHPAHEYFRERTRALREDFARGVLAAQEAGEVSRSLDPYRVAVMLIALLDGLQIAWLHNPDIDMAEHFDVMVQAVLKS